MFVCQSFRARLLVIPGMTSCHSGLDPESLYHDSMGYVYIMTNTRNNVLYIGVTTDLVRRISEHANESGCVFTRKYRCHKLVYYEVFQNPQDAIDRETQLKWWHREWKRSLIEKKNPEWKDLGAGLTVNPII